MSDLTVSPSSWMIGVLQPGQKATKQILIKGTRPFKILSIECDNPAFSCKLPQEAKTVHLVPITFEAGQDPAKIVQKLRIRTDLDGDNQTELAAFGQVVTPLAGK